MDNRLIMLVEDNPDDIELTWRAFEQNNITSEVITSRDGADALDYLLNQGEHANSEKNTLPRLILLDLKLPKIDGLEVLRQIRGNERTKLVPVIVLTSSNEKRDIEKSYTLGANSYIRKPVDFLEFTETVRQLGNYWLTLNEAPPQPKD